MWINPAASSLGAELSPASTLSMATYQDDEVFDTIRIGSSGSSQCPSDQQLDEIRVGTEWADVTPIFPDVVVIPEPASMALLGLCALGFAMVRRRRA